MPAFDVTDAFDPDFFDTFTLVRRVQTISNKGRPVDAETPTPGQYGVVTMASPNDLERLPEADVTLKTIIIVTLVRLQLGSPGADATHTIAADQVEWPEGSGDRYQVKLVEDYSRFGQGYIWSLAQALPYLPQAPTPAV